MLDADTKHRIDAARNILVGKVPDPKSQVEQITIALIYKFMDDMDAESELLGGVRSFFVEKYEQYGWAKLMNSGLGGNEILNRYAEAMTELPRHQGLPQLFRDIFKNAYLPYRDPETLKLFLKQIDGFTYDHSERLGDAFEYLLSVLGTQGDAGQFRTPRHMIDFMVALLNPQKHESVLDPACGTAGFLIAAYKHIAAANRDAQGESTLSQADRVKLANNFVGYDISPDMVRLSRVNLYLHGFATPRIDEYDTLTQLDHWGKTVDVVLANPPFMSPKGGIQTHSKFSVQSKRSEVLFVDYMAEHLSPRGRAAIIVPEGIIFQSGSAYKQLRKMLVEQYLVAVISLPAGLFQPYSGVKTSILVLDRALAPAAKKVAFFTITNDGFALNAQRRPIAANDLPQVLADCTAWMQSLAAGFESLPAHPNALHLVDKTKLAASGDYNLSGERYREGVAHGIVYPFQKLEDIFLRIQNGINVEQTDEGKYRVSRIQTIADGTFNFAKTKFSSDDVSDKYFLSSGDILFSHINSYDHLAKTAIYISPRTDVIHGINLIRLVADQTKIIPKFAINLFKTKKFIDKAKTYAQKAVNQASIKTSDIKALEIPLPPLAIQQAIVAEIERYQTIIDGARAVVDNYQPQIDIDPSWSNMRLGELCQTIMTGPFGSALHQSDYVLNGIPIINPSNIIDGLIVADPTKTVSVETHFRLKDFAILSNDIIIGRRGEMGRCGIATSEMNGWLCGTGSFAIRLKTNCEPHYVYLQLISPTVKAYLESSAIGVTMKNLNQSILSNLKIPLPPLATQQAIVTQIQAEQALVNANRELIIRFEAKIAATLARVWGDAAPSADADVAPH